MRVEINFLVVVFLLETQVEVTFDFLVHNFHKNTFHHSIFQQEKKNPGSNAFMGKHFV